MRSVFQKIKVGNVIFGKENNWMIVGTESFSNNSGRIIISFYIENENGDKNTIREQKFTDEKWTVSGKNWKFNDENEKVIYEK